MLGLAVFPLDSQDTKAQDWLDSQLDDEFSPTFGQYEAFLAALAISPGEPMEKTPEEPSID